MGKPGGLSTTKKSLDQLRSRITGVWDNAYLRIGRGEPHCDGGAIGTRDMEYPANETKKGLFINPRPALEWDIRLHRNAEYHGDTS
jgi:hypothetical protein